MINIIHNRCQSWLYKKAQCRLCIKVCPVEGCISFKGSHLSVNTENCVGCGICTTVCPTSAIEMEGLTDRELWNRLKAALPINSDLNKQTATLESKSEVSLTFGCSLGEDKNMPSAFSLQPSAIHFNLPCLAMLKESHFISLILSGADSIYLDTNNCGDCSFKHGKKTIEKTLAYADNLLNAMGYNDCIETGSRVKCQGSSGQGSGVRGNKKSILSFGKNKKKNIKTITHESEYSRRELLHFFREKAVEKAVERIIGKTTKKKGGGKGGEAIPDRRLILLEALKDRHFQSDVIEDGRFPVHQIRINNDCSLCNDCSLFCPTGALAKVEQRAETDDETGEVRLDFNMSLCMACEQCAELCPEDAMHIERNIELSDFALGSIQILFKKGSKKCPSCNTAYFPEDGVEECLICRKKKKVDDMFFSIVFEQQGIQ